MRLPPDVLQRLADDGRVETEARPLYLPKHSIRAIVILAFAGLAAYLVQQGQPVSPEAWTILGVVFAYFLGMIVRLQSQCRHVVAAIQGGQRLGGPEGVGGHRGTFVYRRGVHPGRRRDRAPPGAKHGAGSGPLLLRIALAAYRLWSYGCHAHAS